MRPQGWPPAHSLSFALIVLLAACGDDGPSPSRLGGTATIADDQGTVVTATADSAAWADIAYNSAQQLLTLHGSWSATTGDNGYQGRGITIFLAGTDLSSILAQSDWAQIGTGGNGFCVMSQDLSVPQYYLADSGSVQLHSVSDSMVEVEYTVRLVRLEMISGIQGPTPLRVSGHLRARRVPYADVGGGIPYAC